MRLVAPLLLLLGACAAHRGPAAPAVDRMAELDRHHGFQDLAFNVACTQIDGRSAAAEVVYGMDLYDLSRSAEAGGKESGPMKVGCYQDKLGLVRIPIEGRAAVRKVRAELSGLYGKPNTSSARKDLLVWRGERVELSFEASEDGSRGTIAYRSLLTEALWQRDLFLASRPPKPSQPTASAPPTSFRFSEDGIY